MIGALSFNNSAVSLCLYNACRRRSSALRARLRAAGPAAPPLSAPLWCACCALPVACQQMRLQTPPCRACSCRFTPQARGRQNTVQASPDLPAGMQQALASCGAALLATAASFVLYAARAEEVTLQFQASKDPEIRRAQTDLVQTYGAGLPQADRDASRRCKGHAALRLLSCSLGDITPPVNACVSTCLVPQSTPEGKVCLRTVLSLCSTAQPYDMRASLVATTATPCWSRVHFGRCTLPTAQLHSSMSSLCPRSLACLCGCDPCLQHDSWLPDRDRARAAYVTYYYVNADFEGADWQGAFERALRQSQAASGAAVVDALTDGLLAQLHDPYTRRLGPQAAAVFRAEQQGKVRLPRAHACSRMCALATLRGGMLASHYCCICHLHARCVPTGSCCDGAV